MTQNLAPHAVHRLEEESKHVYAENWARAVSAIDGEDTSPPDLALSRLYELCLQVFRLMCCANNSTSSSLRQGISESSMRDELARFNLWGDEIALNAIDKALGPEDFLVERILLHLLQIGYLLLKGLIGSRDDESIAALRKILEEKSKSESLTEQANLKGEASEDEDSEDDMADIPEDIGFRTRCLLELSSTIQGCIDRVEYPRFPAFSAKEFTVSGPAYYYVQIVQEKFKEAPIQLVQRLGEANWQRHNRLRRLVIGHKEFNDATTVAEPKSLFHDSGIGTTETGGTSYPASVKSYSSFISSNATGERSGLRVPSVPAEVQNGQPFSCSLCGHVQSKIKNRVDWKIHVFTDLRPYICTFENCREYLSEFSSRTAWANHEFSKHRHQTTWQCLICKQTCTDIEVCKTHLEEAHEIDRKDLADSLAKLVVSTIQARPIELEECFLCKQKPAKTKRAFLKHVGRHMEEIALMAVPVTDDCSNENDSVDTEDNHVSDHPAKKSHPSMSPASPPLIAPEDVQNAERLPSENDIDPGNMSDTPPPGPDAPANEILTKISDLAESRRIQNRIAQGNYRKKIKRRLEDLERKQNSSLPQFHEYIIQGSHTQTDLDSEISFNSGKDLKSQRHLSPASQLGLQDNSIDEKGIKRPQCWEHGCNGRTFSTFSNLLRHQRNKSDIASKLTCLKCGAELTSKTALDEHTGCDKCGSMLFRSSLPAVSKELGFHHHV